MNDNDMEELDVLLFHFDIQIKCLGSSGTFLDDLNW